jgi:hypothetical protein
MAGLVPAIHVLIPALTKDAAATEARARPGSVHQVLHDECPDTFPEIVDYG